MKGFSYIWGQKVFYFGDVTMQTQSLCVPVREEKEAFVIYFLRQ